MNNHTIKFKYKFSEDYNPVYTNGAYGGVGTNGEIVINFYFERNPVPYTEVAKVNNNGEIIDRSIVEPEEYEVNVIRYVSTGVVMNLETAKRIYKWLGQHISNLEKNFEIERGEK